MKLLLLTPPMTQLNTPYPATPYLLGFLTSRKLEATQTDPALDWVLRLLSPAGLTRVFAALEQCSAAARATPAVEHALRHRAEIAQSMPAVLALLQNRDVSLVHRIAARRLLPEGPRFRGVGPSGHEDAYLDWAFGSLGTTDRARYFASLFIEDLADAITAGIDPHFGFARYGESLAASQPTLDPLLDELGHKERVTTQMLHELTLELLREHRPDLIGMTLPFPGNVLGALRMAQTIRAAAPDTRIVWGGGFVNTELREVSDPRLFDYVDFITYDDGEKPLLCLLEHLRGERQRERLLRTRHRDGGKVVFTTTPTEHDIPLRDCGTPTYRGLPLENYLALIDMLNPMQRLWSDTRWNKLTVAHGCYWKKCSFCDVSLDYIGNYDPLAAELIVDRMEALIAENGSRGFHFVDEAAPPAGLRALAQEILARGLAVSWWGNVRFEKAFTKDTCELLARSGCIALSGGLEVASNRLLERMQKGVTVEQVARVTHAMSEAGIRVHAYLMYGFPTQTAQETLDSLEYVRQLFVAGCLDSAFWHRFSATAHAPVGLEPARFGVRLVPVPTPTFARNDLAFEDPTGCDHARFGDGLKTAVYNYMHGLGLEDDVRKWFAHKVPKTSVPQDFIARALRTKS